MARHPSTEKLSPREWLLRVFPELPEPLLSETADRLHELHAGAGTTLVRRGDAADLFYIITSGDVTVTYPKPDGHEMLVATLGPGHFFGEMGLLAGTARTASVYALSDVDLLTLDREGFQNIVQSSGDGTARTADEEPFPSDIMTGPRPPSDYWHGTWARAVRSACHTVLAAHGAVRSVDLIGRRWDSGHSIGLVQLADVGRRTASEYGLEVRVSYARERPVLHISRSAG